MLEVQPFQRGLSIRKTVQISACVQWVWWAASSAEMCEQLKVNENSGQLTRIAPVDAECV